MSEHAERIILWAIGGSASAVLIALGATWRMGSLFGEIKAALAALTKDLEKFHEKTAIVEEIPSIKRELGECRGATIANTSAIHRLTIDREVRARLESHAQLNGTGEHEDK